MNAWWFENDSWCEKRNLCHQGALSLPCHQTGSSREFSLYPETGTKLERWYGHIYYLCLLFIWVPQKINHLLVYQTGVLYFVGMREGGSLNINVLRGRQTHTWWLTIQWPVCWTNSTSRSRYGRKKAPRGRHHQPPTKATRIAFRKIILLGWVHVCLLINPIEISWKDDL